MLLAAALGGLSAAASPNILWIVLDDLGWNDVGWRDPQLRTPTIDRFAREGVILDQYYASEACSPSRATFMTGRFPLHHGIIAWIKPTKPAGLPLRETTVADLLQRGGYETHAIGKWHLGFYLEEMTPTWRGFNSFYGLYGGAADYRSHVWNGHVYDFHRDPEPKCNASCRQVAADDVGIYSTTLFSAEAVRIVAAHDTSKPIFLYLAYQAPHAPLDAPERFEALYDGIISDPMRRTYAAMLSCVDEGIANVTDALDARGMLDDTFLIFTTDNGGKVDRDLSAIGSSNWPLRGGKHTIWEGGTRLVGSVWGGSRLGIARGATYAGMMHGADWLPTLCDLADVSTAGTLPLDGVSQLKNLKDPSLPSPRTSFVYGNSTTADCQWDDNETVCGFGFRKGTWKYIRGYGGFPDSWCNKTVESLDCAAPYGQEPDRCLSGHCLFDVKRDPSEVYDLSAQYPALCAEMDAEADAVLAGYFLVQPDPNCPEAVYRKHPDTPLSGKVLSPWCALPGTPTAAPMGTVPGTPTARPTGFPAGAPPTGFPTKYPATGYPSTAYPRRPTTVPTGFPSRSPPTGIPTRTAFPTRRPTGYPTGFPTRTAFPTRRPTGYPTGFPTRTGFPARPTGYPSGFPARTGFPARPTGYPSGFPTLSPSRFPAWSGFPSGFPARLTGFPSRRPRTGFPSRFPVPPTGFPSPTGYPTRPTGFPSRWTTGFPTSPTGFPRTGYPTVQPTGFPSLFPTRPSGYPGTGYPSRFPTMLSRGGVPDDRP